jgi:acetyl esterase
MRSWPNTRRGEVLDDETNLLAPWPTDDPAHGSAPVNKLAVQNALSRLVMKAPVEGLFASTRRAAATLVDGNRLDPKTRYVLSLIGLVVPPPPETVPPEVARAQYRTRAGAAAPSLRRLARVANVSISTTAGVIPGRVYVPFRREPLLPGLVYFHGGGWVLGDLETHDRLCRVLADDAGCVVVAVDYRLAPEHKFPAATDDAKAAFTWVVANAASLGIDARRVAVAGDSAGGNLAAVVSLAASAGACPAPCYQLLVYPVTDLACDTRSYEQFADGYFLTRNLMLWFRSHYLPSLESVRHPDASPLRADIRFPLAPTLVVTAGFDPLRDEGLAYAKKLRDRGTEVAYRCHDGLIHAFASMSGVIPAARLAVDEMTAALRLAFSRL